MDLAMAYVVDLELPSHPPDPNPSHDPHLQRSLALQAALADVAECRSKLASLGEPPDQEALEQARRAIADIDSALSSDLERLVLGSAPQGMDRAEWRAIQAQKEKDLREAAQITKLPHEETIQTDELYRGYEAVLRDAEEDMVRLSSSLDSESSHGLLQNSGVDKIVNEEVVRILQAAEEGPVEQVELKGRGISCLPDAFGKITTIVTLDLSCNKLEALSDSIGGLTNLQTLNLENNDLGSLPDSIGLLKNLKILNASENKLRTLPESLLQCSSLWSLKADLNQLTFLPSRIGFSLLNLEHLSLQWNKLRSLPASICNLKSLKCLDVRFNHLKALPSAIGNLSNLEILDASCNFMDLQTVPDTIGDMVCLIDLNLSCNQIRTLPDSFGRLQNLKKINLKDNPLICPPLEIVEAGTEAIIAFMNRKWENYLEEEQRRQLAEEQQQQAKQSTWGMGGAWLSRMFSRVSDGQKTFGRGSEDYVEQQL